MNLTHFLRISKCSRCLRPRKKKAVSVIMLRAQFGSYDSVFESKRFVLCKCQPNQGGGLICAGECSCLCGPPCWRGCVTDPDVNSFLTQQADTARISHMNSIAYLHITILSPPNVHLPCCRPELVFFVSQITALSQNQRMAGRLERPIPV